MTDAYIPPTAEEIGRVAAHWERVKDLVCGHTSLVYEVSTSGPMCGECRRPIVVLSDLQLEEKIKAAVARAANNALDEKPT